MSFDSKIITIAIMSIAASLVIAPVLAKFSTIQSPRMIAITVCLLGGLGLLQLDQKILESALLPSAALVITVLIMLAILAVARLYESRFGSKLIFMLTSLKRVVRGARDKQVDKG